MKIDDLLKELDNIQARTEQGEYLDNEHVTNEIILLLVTYINNPRLSSKIDDIPF